MKKLLFICFILLFAITNCDRLKEDEIVARRIIYRVSDTLASHYQLRYVGYSEAGDAKGFSKIGLRFNKFGRLSKEEGRKMIVDCLNVLLTDINSEPEIQQFLINKPFTIANVEIGIVILTNEGKNIFYPDVCVFSAFGGKIYYSTNSSDHESGYYTRESETFEEAVKIVESQNKGSVPLPRKNYY
jgi:hypothetical protein